MEWLKVESIDELKELSGKYGKVNFNEMKAIINKDLLDIKEQCDPDNKYKGDIINIKSRSWAELYQKIIILKDIINKLKLNYTDDTKVIVNTEDSDNIDYFKTKEDELIFYILEVDGKKRSSKLGITRRCFTNKKAARKWKNDILLKIHPDKTNNKYASQATIEINQLYKEMVGND